ncbi:hypothetical protein GCM10027360_05260 [Amycolatopsis echigonensis]
MQPNGVGPTPPSSTIRIPASGPECVSSILATLRARAAETYFANPKRRFGNSESIVPDGLLTIRQPRSGIHSSIASFRRTIRSGAFKDAAELPVRAGTRQPSHVRPPRRLGQCVPGRTLSQAGIVPLSGPATRGIVEGSGRSTLARPAEIAWQHGKEDERR